MAPSMVRTFQRINFHRHQFCPSGFKFFCSVVSQKDHIRGTRYLVDRHIAKTPEKYLPASHLPPEQPDDPHLLRIAVLGTPNTGKSTLTNTLMGWRVNSVSPKVHTTKRKTIAVTVEDNTQLVILDTPGLVSLGTAKKYHLEQSVVRDPQNALQEADLVVVMVDISNKFANISLDRKVIRLLELFKTRKSILVLNKIDLAKNQNHLLDMVTTLTEGKIDGRSSTAFKKNKKSETPIVKLFDNMKKAEEQAHQMAAQSDHEQKIVPSSEESTIENTSKNKLGWQYFKEVFMISALNGTNVDRLKNFLIRSAKSQPWIYHHSVITDQKPQEITELAIRENLMEYLPHEVPYEVNLILDLWKEDDAGVLWIVYSICCSNERQMKIILGPQGNTIKKIAAAASQQMMNTFRCQISLKLEVIRKRTK